MNPLISYYGGKQRIAQQIVKQINLIPHAIYCEPFFGGGAVFFARERPRNLEKLREVINDKEELLINLYRFARNNPEEFKRMMAWTPYSESEHRKAKEICKNSQDSSEKERAWAYYVNINQGFANKLNAGWGRNKYSQNSVQTWHNKKQRGLIVGIIRDIRLRIFRNYATY